MAKVTKTSPEDETTGINLIKEYANFKENKENNSPQEIVYDKEGVAKRMKYLIDKYFTSTNQLAVLLGGIEHQRVVHWTTGKAQISQRMFKNLEENAGLSKEFILTGVGEERTHNYDFKNRSAKEIKSILFFRKIREQADIVASLPIINIKKSFAGDYIVPQDKRKTINLLSLLFQNGKITNPLLIQVDSDTLFHKYGIKSGSMIVVDKDYQDRDIVLCLWDSELKIAKLNGNLVVDIHNDMSFIELDAKHKNGENVIQILGRVYCQIALL